MGKRRTLNAYQADAMRTAGEGDLICAALGLAGESGEFADSVKKYKYHGHQLDHAHLLEELGDVLWYVALGARELDVTLEDVARENLLKLQRRYPEGWDAQRSIHRDG
jgi:NTP pyrophosphatase (non-canonical NTP hydrolase)